MFKQILKKIYFLFCLVCFCIPLTGCFYSIEKSVDEKFVFGVNSRKKDAFCILYAWDGTNQVITIPDEFMGCKVSTLGGYTGRGYPCPFHIELDFADGYFFNMSEDELVNDEYEILTCYIHLGYHLSNVDYVNGQEYFARTFVDEFNKEQIDVLYKLVYYFTVDEKNSKLYAKDGKLYYRESNEMISDFFYK